MKVLCHFKRVGVNANDAKWGLLGFLLCQRQWLKSIESVGYRNNIKRLILIQYISYLCRNAEPMGMPGYGKTLKGSKAVS